MGVIKMKNGDTVTVKRFAYTNKSGGTELVDMNCRLAVVKSWEDYETGNNAWAMPNNTNTELMDFLNTNAKKGTPDYNVDTYEVNYSDEDLFIVFVSEFDVVDDIADGGEFPIDDDVLFDIDSDSFLDEGLCLTSGDRLERGEE